MGRKSNTEKYPGWRAPDRKTKLKDDSVGVEFGKWRHGKDDERSWFWSSGATTLKAAIEAELALLNSDEARFDQRGADVEFIAAGDHWVRHVLNDGFHRDHKSHGYRWDHVRHNFERGRDGKPVLLATPECEELLISVLERIRANDPTVRRFRKTSTGKTPVYRGLTKSGGGINYERMFSAIINHACKAMKANRALAPQIVGQVRWGPVVPRKEYLRIDQRDATAHYLADRPDADGRLSLAHRFFVILAFTGCRLGSGVSLRWERGDGPYVDFNHATKEVYFDFTGWYSPEGDSNKRGGQLWRGGVLYDFMLRCFEQRKNPYVFELPSSKERHNEIPERLYRKAVESDEFVAAVGELPATNPHTLKHTYSTLGRECGVSTAQLAEDTGTSYEMLRRVYAKVARRPSATLDDWYAKPAALWGSKDPSNVTVLPKRG